MYVQQRVKLILAVIFALFVSLAIVGVTYSLFPMQQSAPNSSPSPTPTGIYTLPPGQYSPSPSQYSPQSFSIQIYVMLLITFFIIAVGVTVGLLWFSNRHRRNLKSVEHNSSK